MLIGFFAVSSAIAQVPGVFNYQAVIRDAEGQGLADKQLDLRFQLYDDPLDGSVVFVEEFEMVPTGLQGVIHLQIGRNGSNDLRQLNWKTTPFFINIQMRESESGGAYTNITAHRIPLVSVPMALFAHEADTARYAQSSRLITNPTLQGSGTGIDSLGIARMGAQQGQVLRWDNGRWRPGTINAGGGPVVTDQSTLAGDGTLSDPLRIRNLGVTNDELANNAITSNKIADGEIQAVDLSDMGAAFGDVLVYRQGGWRAEEPSGSSSSPWTKVGNSVFVNNGEYVGINTNDPQHLGLTIYDGALAINSPQQIVTSNLLMNTGNLEISTAYSIISSSYTNLSAGTLEMATYGFSGGQTSGDLYIHPLSIILRSGENNASVESSFHLNGMGSGYMNVAGENGLRNVRLTNILSEPNKGYVGVFDQFDESKVALYVNSLNQGEIVADVKNFRMSNPRDPSTDIWYACLEGPEAGAYERGTATLVQGEIFIPFSTHFQSVINPSTMTVILTPHSTDTYGLAVIEKRADGIRVKELKNGNGSFSLDWEVKAVRAGFEDYKVIRDKNYARPE